MLRLSRNETFGWLAGALLLQLLFTCSAEETPWNFLVMADWHGAEFYSHKPVPGQPNDVLFNLQKSALEHIRDLYGGDLVLIPGDTNTGEWYRQEWVDKHFPGYSIQDAVYQAGINCYSTIKNLFSSSGYNKVLAAIGDHELGDNYWGEYSPKTASIKEYRESFVQAFYMDSNSNEYIFKDDGIGNAGPTPYGTDHEKTSFAHQHKNVLFITVDVFHKASNKEYFDRQNGLGGEGLITADVAGSHLQWFEEVLIEARKDSSISHIIVQAHVPILEPVRKIFSSAMFFDGGENSLFWKKMVEYKVDVYIAGEVHANTASKTEGSDLIQIVSVAGGMLNFLRVSVTEDSLQFDVIHEIGPQIDLYSKSEYEKIGSLTIDKSSGSTQISSSGELELLDVARPLLHFNFEEFHGINERQVLGLQTLTNLRPKEVPLRDMVVYDCFWNHGSFGKQYDAPVGNVKIAKGGIRGNAGYFDGATSQMGVYSIGPNVGGSVISYSMWFKTNKIGGEMILIHYGQAWGRANHPKNILSLTLKNGAPKLYASQTSFLQPSVSGKKLNDGGWHMIAVSMPRRSARLSEVQLYIDGKIIQTSVRNDMNLFFFNYGRINIGSLAYSSTTESDFPTWTTFHGHIDEVYVWVRKISYWDLMESPRKDFERKINCKTIQKKGMDIEILDDFKKRNRCKRRCSRDITCMGFKFLSSKASSSRNRTKCFLFKHNTPKLQKREKEGHTCYTL